MQLEGAWGQAVLVPTLMQQNKKDQLRAIRAASLLQFKFRDDSAVALNVTNGRLVGLQVPF